MFLHYEPTDSLKSLIAKLETAVSHAPIGLIAENTGRVIEAVDGSCEALQPEGVVYFVFKRGMRSCLCVFLPCLILR